MAAPPEVGIYVYGIFPADIELVAERAGVGNPPGPVRIVRGDGLAALVSEVDLSQPLGTPDDLRVHKEILDESAADVPVLPLRFGSVLASDEEVARDLLEPHKSELAAALGDLDGRAEYVVKGRYVEDVILSEVLAQDPEAARLRDEIRGADPDATRPARIRLGELISSAVTTRREADTHALGDVMAGHCAASVVRDPTHELDAVHVAFLLDLGQEDDLDQAVDNLARQWANRVELRVLGPMAAYDFTGITGPGG